MDTSTFEKYLLDIHARDYHGTNNFEQWFGRLDGDEILKYAEDFATELNEKLKSAMKLASDAVYELQKIKEMINELKLTP